MTIKKVFLAILVLALIWNVGLPLLGFTLGVAFDLIKVVLIVSCVCFGVKLGKQWFDKFTAEKNI